MCSCSGVSWKADLASDASGEVAEAICEAGVEGTSGLLLTPPDTAHSTLREEGDDFKTELFSEKEAELKDWGNYQLIYTGEKENVKDVPK